MSVTVELSELDAFLWDAFRRGGEWVNASEYRKLMAQNAKLREEIEAAKHDLQVFSMGSVQLEAENAKLRECLQDLAEHIREDDGFGLDYGWMLDRMRELGVTS